MPEFKKSNGFKMKGPTFYGSAMRKSKHANPGIKTTENMEAPSPNKALCPAPPSVKKKMKEEGSATPYASPAKNKEKKRIKVKHKNNSTEYITGGRDGDKKHKSTTYSKNYDPSGRKVTKTTRTKDKDGNVIRKDKVISKTRANIEKGIRNIFYKSK